MSNQFPKAISPLSEDLRAQIVSDPDMILEDLDVMRALVSANEKATGGNIVDLRGIAMDRLETRLDRLEDTHRGVIAAAYENLAGTNQIHRAILSLLDAGDFAEFLVRLNRDVADILRVDAVKLLLETEVEEDVPALKQLGDVVVTAEPGFATAYLTHGRNIPARAVTLRQVSPETSLIYGDASRDIHSEACMLLDIGEDRLPALLVLGSEDPHQFRPAQGTDLLGFLGGVFERLMRNWLA